MQLDLHIYLQGALNGAGASLFGLGSDIGGSIRLPSLFCGIFGHKPTGGVISVEGHFPSDELDEEFGQFLVLGPMTRFATDLPQLLQIMVGPEQAGRLRLAEPVPLKELQVHYAFGFPGLNGRMHQPVDTDIQHAIWRAVEHLESTGLAVQHAELSGLEDSMEIGMAGIARLGQMQYILPEGNVWSTLGQLLCSISGCGQSKYTRDALIFELMRRTNAFMGVHKLQHYRSEGQRLAKELSVSKCGAISNMHVLPNPNLISLSCFSTCSARGACCSSPHCIRLPSAPPGPRCSCGAWITRSSLMYSVCQSPMCPWASMRRDYPLDSLW